MSASRGDLVKAMIEETTYLFDRETWVCLTPPHLESGMAIMVEYDLKRLNSPEALQKTFGFDGLDDLAKAALEYAAGDDWKILECHFDQAWHERTFPEGLIE